MQTIGELRQAFQRDERVLVCLTTLHHRRFVEDAIHVVGMPRGAHVRLRYRKQYVDESFWDQVRSGVLPAKPVALVALAATNAAGQSEIEPVRRGTVIGARCEGSVLILDVSLEEFLFEPGQLGEFWQELKSVAANLPPRFSPGFGGSYLQLLSRTPQTLVASNGVSAWETVAEGFFRVANSSLNSEAEKQSPIPFLFYIAKLSPRILGALRHCGSIDVDAGANLRVEVHTIAALSGVAYKDALGEVLLELSHPAASFVSSRRVRVDSRRDAKTITITTSPVFRRTSGHLSVRTVRFGTTTTAGGSTSPASKREEFVVARYDFPLRVGRMVPWLASSLVSLAAGLAALKLPETGEPALRHFIVPSLAFVLAFAGVTLGLRSDVKR